MKQQLLLQSAKICTIDSFCGDLVRENFHMLGISADYQIADYGELARFEDTAVKKVLADKYNSGDPVFKELSDTVSTGGSDAALEGVIKSVYASVSSFPFPEDEVAKLAEPYKGNEPVAESIWGRYILKEASAKLRYCQELMEQCSEILSDPDTAVQEVADALGTLVPEEIAHYRNMADMADSGKWDDLYYAVNYHVYQPFTRKRKIDATIKNAVKQRRDRAKAVADKVKGYICVNSIDFDNDRKSLLSLVECLADCVVQYSRELDRIKRLNEKFDFGDIEHLALELLIERDGDKVSKTALAQSLSET